MHNELWISQVCDANGENCSVSDIEVTPVMTEECYTVVVDHTETPSSGSCDTGDGEIPILKPPLDLNNAIDYTSLNPCLQVLIDRMINHFETHNKLDEILQDFAGYQPHFNLKMVEGTLPPNVVGRTSARYDQTDGSVTITFDSRKFANATDISVIQTMYHEIIHAYTVAVNYTTGTQQQREQLLGSDWMMVYQNSGHDYMIRNFVIPMAELLEIYANNNNIVPSDPNFFTDMAYAGLTHNRDGTERLMFKQMVPKASDRKRIVDTITIEGQGVNFNGVPKPQTGNASGC